jgi:hypothetical protein
MEKILELCEWCSDVFGTTLLILLVLIFLPAIVAVAMLLFVVAVPVGIVYGIVKAFRNPNKTV